MNGPPSDLVVVIEDDPRLSAALGVLLSHWGYCCLFARCPQEALAASGARASEVRAVIADIEIDAQRRAQSSASLFAEAAGRLVPVLLTTSDAGSTRHGPGVSVLAKPFDPDKVRQWLAEHVRPASLKDACPQQ